MKRGHFIAPSFMVKRKKMKKALVFFWVKDTGSNYVSAGGLKSAEKKKKSSSKKRSKRSRKRTKNRMLSPGKAKKESTPTSTSARSKLTVQGFDMGIHSWQ